MVGTDGGSDLIQTVDNGVTDHKNPVGTDSFIEQI